jgi:4a-hydroxytetrahydrobiopterin dehydratase
MQKLAMAQIRKALKELPGWRRRRGALERECVLPDFAAALRLVNRVGRLAEAAGHHPDIDIRWNRVRLALTTHAAGGLTELDLQMAGRLNRLLASPARARRG